MDICRTNKKLCKDEFVTILYDVAIELVHKMLFYNDHVTIDQMPYAGCQVASSFLKKAYGKVLSSLSAANSTTTNGIGSNFNLIQGFMIFHGCPC